MDLSRKLVIGGVQPLSTVDFPGKIAAVVFTQGCPWRCPYCYNVYLQEAKPDTNVVWGKFMEFLEKRKMLLNAVVFSGGEPLLQDALEKAVHEVNRIGYAVGVHTNGIRPDFLEKLMPKIDWVGLDIKAPFETEKYKKASGGIDALADVLKSLDVLIKSGKPFECRTTCDPRILDIEDIKKIADSLKEKGVKSYHLQKYRPIPGDNTSESDCNKFFGDENLISYLKQSFPDFSIRQ